MNLFSIFFKVNSKLTGNFKQPQGRYVLSMQQVSMICTHHSKKNLLQSRFLEALLAPLARASGGSELNKLDYSSAIDQERLLYYTYFSLLPYMYIFIIAIVGATVKDNFTVPCSGFCLWRDKHRIFVLNFDKFWPFIAKIIQTSDDTTQRFDFFLSFLYFDLLGYDCLNLLILCLVSI